MRVKGKNIFLILIVFLLALFLGVICFFFIGIKNGKDAVETKEVSADKDINETVEEVSADEKINEASEEVSADENLYETGEKYLIDGEYEKALEVFLTLIDEDSLDCGAYIGAANAYQGLEDYQAAIDILSAGYELTNDATLKETLDEVTSRARIINHGVNIQPLG